MKEGYLQTWQPLYYAELHLQAVSAESRGIKPCSAVSTFRSDDSVTIQAATRDPAEFHCIEDPELLFLIIPHTTHHGLLGSDLSS